MEDFGFFGDWNWSFVSLMSKQQDLLFQKVKSYIGGKTKIMQNYRPDWLKNPHTQKNLEIDIYLPEFKIGIEYQGGFHFLDGSKKTDSTRYRDTLKHELAKKKKVFIVEFFEEDLSHHPFGEIFDKRLEQVSKKKYSKKLLNRVREVKKHVKDREMISYIKKENRNLNAEFHRKLLVD